MISFHLITILEENHHSLMIVENDSLLYKDAGEMVEYIAQAMKQTPRETMAEIFHAPPGEIQRIAQVSDLLCVRLLNHLKAQNLFTLLQSCF